MHLSTSIGASLQACALGKKLLGDGHEPYLLYYAPSFYTDVLVPIVPRLSPRSILSYVLNGRNREKARQSFLCFKTMNHAPLTKKYTSINELYSDTPRFDAYICGSDQVWNSTITHYDMSYFFPFGPSSTKKISYAASIGQDRITEDDRQFLIDGLANMDFIGVREDTAVSVIHSIYPEAEVVQNIDPTFFLDRITWESMSNKPLCELPKRYILYYPINSTELGLELLNEAKQKYRIPCVSFSSSIRDNPGVDMNLHGIGPAEFLYLCNHAELVITNSFHGFAISIIHRKKVMCFTKQNQNSRMESLSRLLNLRALMVNSVNEAKARDWEQIWNSCYESISKRISCEQDKADEYLRRALS